MQSESLTCPLILILILVFFLARSSSMFLHCFFFLHSFFFFFSLTRAMLRHCIALSYLFSSIVYSLSLNVSDQVRADTVPVWGRGTAQYTLYEGGEMEAAYSWEWLTLFRHSPQLWLVGSYRDRWILANQIRAIGWSHRQWIFTQLTCILFYCQMRNLSNITKNKTKLIQTTALTAVAKPNFCIIWHIFQPTFWTYCLLNQLLKPTFIDLLSCEVILF